MNLESYKYRLGGPESDHLGSPLTTGETRELVAEVERLRLLVRTIVSQSRPAFTTERRDEIYKLAGIEQ